MSPRRATSALLAIGTAALVAIALTATPATASRHDTTTRSTTSTGQAQLRQVGATAVTLAPGAISHRATGTSPACTLPDGGTIAVYHCYTPQDIRAAYGVDQLADQGQGRTIVLVDSYGSPTAAADLQKFHDTFFPNLPDPSFEQVFPQGNPQFGNTVHGNGKSGPAAAAGWSGEATLDVEWAYSIAPRAHLVLVAVPPAETLGVQGFPNLFKAISHEIDVTPPGTVFSMSFAVAEQTFGGAAKVQTARFDKVFQKGNAKGDSFFGATGDEGTANVSKQHGGSAPYSYPTTEWPASSPYVTAVGGTQLQDGWTWDPTSNVPFTSSGYNLPYWQSTDGGHQNTVWNESWGPIGSGGGSSVIYPKPAWQAGAGHYPGRTVPDVSWNAAVNGGVDVWISAYPEYNCGNTTGCWTIFGGTSAATPQVAALTALADQARAGAGEPPLGNLNPRLYQLPKGAIADVVPVHEGSAPAEFAGSDVQPDGSTAAVSKSVGDLVDNQMWMDGVPGYPTTTGYDLTTGLGTPNAAAFVAALTLP
ncbi:MAG TPA: S53 family peptidase [Marmoricola sp.]|nr:S53 family peptidase [Marmoricola sp.]